MISLPIWVFVILLTLSVIGTITWLLILFIAINTSHLERQDIKYQLGEKDNEKSNNTK